MIALFERWTIGAWRQIDQDWMETDRTTYDWRPLIVLALTCVSLTLQEYYGQTGGFRRFFPERFVGEYAQLESYAWWSGWRFLGYVVLPSLVIFCLPGERWRDTFVSLRGFVRHLWIYVLLFALMIPILVVVSRFGSFSDTYPFYRLAHRSAFDFWAWEALYALQFLSLEFFFRGFMLKMLAPRMGSTAIFVMLVPYCMIHFGKPVTETLAAIVAGIILGTLALRTRSIWGGVLIHVGVAVTMDLLTVGQLAK